MRRHILCTLFAALFMIGCGQKNQPNAAPQTPNQTLVEARAGFTTNLTRRTVANEPVPPPLPQLFTTVLYDSPVGKLAAYLTPNPRDGLKRPAIIWITGGDCNTIGDVWSSAPQDNDQTASAYRNAGLVMMFPSLRGGNRNPGFKEGFLGEVDDVIAAATFLSQQPYVDPQRIYLGGHSTGGTLALLVAECSDQFRAVFSFGPAHEVRGYGPEYLPIDLSNSKEIAVRSPGLWLSSIRSPTFVFEGMVDGNVESLRVMSQSNTNPKVQFFPIAGGNHFSILAPINKLIVTKIVQDVDTTCNLSFTPEDLQLIMGR